MSDPSPASLEVFRRALSELREMRGEVERLRRAARSAREPVAVVGIGCRFPGGGDGPDAFWEALRAGVDGVVEEPPGRCSVEEFTRGRSDGTGEPRPRCGFLPRVDLFDAGFFGISRREAEVMDPQQRLLLEVAWEALEDAGHAPSGLSGSRTGVFVGVCNNDYFQLGLERARGGTVDPTFSTGNSISVVAGRLSHLLGLRGPSLVIDTACSSSLVALHAACQSLRTGECDLALAGGVNLIISPLSSLALSAVRVTSAEGRCRTFDADADGFVRGEGCGVVVLRRLSDALGDGDRVVGIVKGSAVGHDGRSSSLTAPNGPAQEAVIRSALEAAGLSPADVDYVEAHGTGTPLGDPIEMGALRSLLAPGREPARPLLVGSVKTNIGHLEGAAGVAGLVKVLLALEREEIPAHLHLRRLNPELGIEGLPISIPTERTPWRRGERPRRAGVSSFGFSGTNAHVVVEEAPAAPPPRRGGATGASTRPGVPVPYLLSAGTPGALRTLAARHAARLGSLAPGETFSDALFTAAVGRSPLACRLALSVDGAAQATGLLDAFARGEAPDGVTTMTSGTTETAARGGSRVLFTFDGSGRINPSGGRALFEGCPPFLEAVEECRRAAPPGCEGLLDVIAGGEGEPEAGTPLDAAVRFALGRGLAAILRSVGVVPSAVAGEGGGEELAAFEAGALDLAGALWRCCGGAGERGTFSQATIPLVAPGPARPGEVLLVLSPGSASPSGARNLLARLWAGGGKADWDAAFGGAEVRRISLPTTPFERERYWLDGNARPAGLPQWCYEIVFREAPLPVPSAADPPADGWEVVGGKGPVGSLLGSLARSGAPLGGGGPGVIRRVLCVAALDAPGNDLRGESDRLLAGAISIVQELLRSGAPSRLVVATRGVTQAGGADEPVALAGAGLRGLLRTVAVESPGMAVTLVDLEPGTTDEAAAAILRAELAASDGEEEVAWRAGRRLAARLVRLAADPAPAPRLSPEAVFLVTGGLGGLGLAAASWLADAGARHLVLAGRTGLDGKPAGRGEEIRSLEARGVEVHVARCDVAASGEAERLVREIVSSGRELRGIVHAAGQLADAALPDVDAARLAASVAVKRDGAIALDVATRGMPLDLFVLYSSAASLLGSEGQAGHAAACSFLDALAAERRRLGLPALSVSWGAWAGAGAVADPGVARRLAARGLVPMPAERALSLLPALLARGPAHAGVLDVDWARVLAGGRGSRPLLAELRPRRDDAPFLARLRAEPPSRRRETILALVSREVMSALGLCAAVDPSRPLVDLGMDSVLALELREALGRETGLSLPSTLLFDRPTVEALAEELRERLGDPGATAVPPAAIPVAGTGAGTDFPAFPGFDPPPVAQAAPGHLPGRGIAVIGIGCRFPGGVTSAGTFWELLAAGVDAVGDPPASRRSLDPLRRPAGSGLATGQGGYLERVDLFDAELFGISPREAASMDPQQRLLLETAWEAFEDAGLAPDSLGGTPTGVFVGLCNTDYARLALGGGGDGTGREVDPYAGTGNAPSVAAGRLSYTFGLRGPAYTIDTACSSSLAAVHLAVESLRRGECRTAVAGGVNLILSPSSTQVVAALGMSAPDGRCKTFDAAADGYVRGEGCGLVVLQPLEEALASGRRVLAVIRGTAANHDGRSGGLTAPSGPAQEEVVRRALADAGIDDPARVGLVEAHGTGTALGDPIELHALRAVLCPPAHPRGPLLVSSVKTNLGHLEAAAGIAGLVKAVLALGHAEVPPHLHFRQLSPHIDLGDAPIAIPTARTPWPAAEFPRLAGVSSFGFSGTNIHVVVEEARGLPEPPRLPDRAAQLLLLSGRTPEALRSAASRLERHLASPAGEELAGVAATLATWRAHLAERFAAVVRSREEGLAVLSRFRSGERSPGILSGRADPGERPVVAFLFTGQGAQGPGMGRALWDSEPLFRRAIEEFDAVLAPHLDVPLRDLLLGTSEPGAIHETARTQPALVALELALVRLLGSWGLAPAWTFGHSVGEIAAAAAAGILSEGDALRFAARRGALMGALPAGGAMAALLAPEGEVRGLLGRLPAGERALLSIAAVNGPSSTVVSGGAGALERFLAIASAAGLASERLTVSHAFHSPLLEPVLDELERVASEMPHAPGRAGLVLDVTGAAARPGELCGAYWRRQAREAVRFDEGIRSLAAQGVDTFVEVGPHPVLVTMGRRCVGAHAGRAPAWIGTLRRGVPADGALLAALGELHVRGVPVDWKGVHRERGRTVTLPSYPFERTSHWLPAETGSARPGDEVATVATGATGVSAPAPPLPGRAIATPLARAVFETTVGLETFPLLEGHVVGGRVVVPGAFHLAVLASAAQSLVPGPFALEAVAFREPLVLADDESLVLQVTAVTGPAPGTLDLRVGTLRGEEWTSHAEATLAPIVGEGDRAVEEAAGPLSPSDPGEVYAFLEATGVSLGAGFRWIRSLRSGPGEAVATLDGDDAGWAAAGLLHPGLVDGAFQVIAAAGRGSGGEGAALTLPFAVDRFALLGPLAPPLTATARVRPSGGSPPPGDVVLRDASGQVVLAVRGLRLREADRGALAGHGSAWLHEVAWRVSPVPDSSPSLSGRWLVVASDPLLARRVAEAVERAGASCAVAVERRAGGAVEATGSRGLAADPASAEEVARLLAAVETEGSLSGVLDLWPLGAGEGSPEADLERDQERVAAGALHLVQALAARGVPTRLVLVTRGAQALPGDAPGRVAPVQALAWGLGRVVALESPEMGPLRLDLDPDPEADLARDLVAAVAADSASSPVVSGDREEEVALRGGVRFVPRLVRSTGAGGAVGTVDAEGASGGGSTHPAEGTFLVTGGMGGLGLAVARFLAARGARGLVLVGRRPPSGPAREEIRALEAAGVRVETVAVDVSEGGAAARIRSALAGLPPLAGVVHAAGVLDDATLLQLDWSRFRKVLAPKVAGTLALAELAGGVPFVLFSSAAGLLGSAGQGAYAAANAFLDSFAPARGALSVGWGRWSGSGMASRAAAGGRWLRWSGAAFGEISPERGLALLDFLLSRGGGSYVAVLPVDWGALLAGGESGTVPPLLRELARPGPRVPPASPETLRARLESAPPGERYDLLAGGIWREALRTLGLPGGRPLEPRTPLRDLGLDSLMAVEVRNALARQVEMPLPATLLFDYPTVEAAAHALSERLGLEAGLAVAPPPSPGVARQVEVLGRMSEEELSAVVDDELGHLLEGP